MKTVRTYSNINDALLGQSWLASNEIESFIPDEVTASAALPHLSVYSGIRLQVNEENFDRADKLLAEHTTPDPLIEALEAEKEKRKNPTARPITLAGFKALVGADIVVYVLTILLSLSQSSYIPEDILRYSGDQYISYPLAVLIYDIWWPLNVILFIPTVALLFLQNWARPLYILAWILGLLQALFSTAYFVYPSIAFLSTLSTLIGGFVCCTIYFTSAAEYFTRNRSEPVDRSNG